MRAYRFQSLTKIEDLHPVDEPMPVPQRGEVLIKVHAVSLNFRDLAAVLGRYVQPVKSGLIPTSDAAGEVVEVGEGVRIHSPGDWVISAFHPRWIGGPMPRTAIKESYGTGQDGWLTQYKVVSQEAVVPMPRHLSYEESCTLPCAGATAWNALTGSTPIRAGHTVLTLGSGGVSVFAIQLAKAAGARVIATTSSDDKAEILRGLGADEVLNYQSIPDWSVQVRELTGGRGVDRVIEVGGPGTINQSLRAITYGSEIVLIGFVSEGNPGMDYFDLKASGAVLRSIGVGDRAVLESLVRAVSGAKIRPVVDRVFPFDDAREAFAHLQSGTHIGKIVIRIDH